MNHIFFGLENFIGFYLTPKKDVDGITWISFLEPFRNFKRIISFFWHTFDLIFKFLCVFLQNFALS